MVRGAGGLTGVVMGLPALFLVVVGETGAGVVAINGSGLLGAGRSILRALRGA